MSLVTGSPFGTTNTQEELYIDGAPTIFFQDYLAAPFYNPDAQGYYWGMSGTPTYPVKELACITDVSFMQGIESVDTYVALVHPHTTIIENNNEIEIIAPANSLYYGEHFRVKGNPQRTSTGSSDSRGYLLVSLQRVEKSRTIQ